MRTGWNSTTPKTLVRFRGTENSERFIHNARCRFLQRRSFLTGGSLKCLLQGRLIHTNQSSALGPEVWEILKRANVGGPSLGLMGATASSILTVLKSS